MRGHRVHSLWMHNNFLVDRTGKMSKSSGEFLTAPDGWWIADFTHSSYRLMCLQAQYRSRSWSSAGRASTAAQVRLKRLVQAVARRSARAP